MEFGLTDDLTTGIWAARGALLLRPALPTEIRKDDITLASAKLGPKIASILKGLDNSPISGECQTAPKSKSFNVAITIQAISNDTLPFDVRVSLDYKSRMILNMDKPSSIVKRSQVENHIP